MAPTDWRTGTPLTATLQEEPYRFDFFQAVRLLHRLYEKRKPVGRNENPADEIVRFQSHLSLSFPPSAIYGLTPGESDPQRFRMVVTFMGLTGPMGVLPRHYTELLMERLRGKDHTLRDFLDLFNHRMVSLFYRAWEKHRIFAGFELAHLRHKRDDLVARELFTLMGLGTKGVRHRVTDNDRSLLVYAGLMSQRPHSALALERCLSDYLAVPVTVKQFVGAWLPLASDDRTCLGSGERNNALGRSAIAGTSVWDQQARFHLRLGPLSYEEFAGILPTGKRYSALVQLTKFFAGLTLEFDVRPVLKKAQVPACRLSRTPSYAPYLGWNTWLKTTEFEQDAEDVIFAGRLDQEMVGTA